MLICNELYVTVFKIYFKVKLAINFLKFYKNFKKFLLLSVTEVELNYK